MTQLGFLRSVSAFIYEPRKVRVVPYGKGHQVWLVPFLYECNLS